MVFLNTLITKIFALLQINDAIRSSKTCCLILPRAKSIYRRYRRQLIIVNRIPHLVQYIQSSTSRCCTKRLRNIGTGCLPASSGFLHKQERDRTCFVDLNWELAGNGRRGMISKTAPAGDCFSSRRFNKISTSLALVFDATELYAL